MYNENLIDRKLIIQNICEDSIKKLIEIDEYTKILNKDNITSLSGLSGIILLLGEISQISNDNKWQEYSIKYIKILNEHLNRGISNISVFNGLAGTGYSILNNSYNTNIFNDYLKSINRVIVEFLDKYLNEFSIQMINLECCNGLVGIGRYLVNFKTDNNIVNIIKRIMFIINKFSEAKIINNIKVPGWFQDSNQIFNAHKFKFPDGYCDLGMAHGISGILSFLSICIINGIEVKGQKEQIKELLDFIEKYRFTVDNKIYVASVVSLESIKDISKVTGNNANTWCNGIMGIARAIYLGGEAIGSSYYKGVAIEVVRNSYNVENDDINSLGLISPTFCHGYSGYMNMLNLFYKDTNDKTIEGIYETMIDKVLEFYEPKSIYSFLDYDYSGDIIVKNGSLNISIGSTSVLLALMQTLQKDIKLWNGIYLLN